jgi:hypothetical protein
MLWRPIAITDLDATLSIDPFSFGDEIVGRSRALAAYEHLVRTKRFLSAVVEEPLHDGRRQLIGFGGALFVSQAFFEAEMRDPQPGLNARIIASVARKRPVVLDEDEIRQSNTDEGLNVVITHASWIPHALSAEQRSAFEGAMSYAFFQLVRGYRLLRLFREAGSAEAVAHIQSQHVFATKVSFDEFFAENPGSRWNHDRALFVAEREHCLSVPASVAAMLFSYSEPILQLRDTDQELLLAALNGVTDHELAQMLQLKLPALKKRWTSLFERVRQVRSDLLPYPQPDAADKRGPQKRHRLLAYLREHPEELRPRRLPGPRRQR